ncbi:hypothetical protein CYMTET_12768 [Cymbomonas tetramitiformis]|uniref:DNA repair protein RAD51 homolog 3 n=1 Tax=Cymbomonas tetramitiformis TaxID=36881 RepID=A0AAE0GJU1_9CHLO|nr:hypothetical protein CYMTET_12768 [Cymbomonas tetramitiformis]
MQNLPRETCSLPLNPSVRQKLQASGFRTVHDIRETGLIALSKEAKLTHDEALAVIKVCRDDYDRALSGAKTAAQILQEERTRVCITTSCLELDKLLGGGISPTEITELCGVPGIGKTQLGMQLAVNVQIPVEFGGLGGHAIYVDTEGSLMAERVLDMANECVERLRNAAVTSGRRDQSEAAAALSSDVILSHIHYLRVHSATEQRAVLHSLPDLLTSDPKVCRQWLSLFTSASTAPRGGQARLLQGRPSFTWDPHCCSTWRSG